MPHENTSSPVGKEGDANHKQSEWYSAVRQAQRYAVRLRWAQSLLEEELWHPGTHSAVRIQLASGVVAAGVGNQMSGT